MNFFSPEYCELHKEQGQFSRQLRALELKKMDSINVKTETGKISTCFVSLEKCSCPDFQSRRKPCKHMYRLAMDLGIFSMEPPPSTTVEKFRSFKNGVLEILFNIENGIFSVYFRKDIFGVKAHCSCTAGRYKTLCRHVIQCIDEDEEIQKILREENLLDLYEEYLRKDSEADRLKQEAKKLKKEFTHFLLE